MMRNKMVGKAASGMYFFFLSRKSSSHLTAFYLQLIYILHSEGKIGFHICIHIFILMVLLVFVFKLKYQ